MTLVGKTSHALFFNGVNDSVICPQNNFAYTGLKIPGGQRSSQSIIGPGDGHREPDNATGFVLESFTVEAWITPDCGGVVAVKDDLFELRVGQVHAPGPASFTVHIRNEGGGKKSVTCKTAEGNTGILYPTHSGSFITSDNDLSKNTRELLHVVGIFSGEYVLLYVNGDLVASEEVTKGSRAKNNSHDFYIGGRGGQFRGTIESVHWRRGFNESGIRPQPVTRGEDTLGLWRFEEPVEVDSNIFHIKSNASADATTLTLDTTQVQTLYQAISGKSDTFSGTYTVPSLGNYQVLNTVHSGGAQTISIAHTTHNLLINPTSTDINTAEPNNKPPERVRLLSLSDAGTVTVNSVHLDFDTTTDTGARGILHGRTAFDATNNLANDSTMVLIKSDLLIDSGTGKPLQPPGLGSQAIDRTGGMVIDESRNGNHGFIFSRRISVNNSNNPYTVSSANWSVDDRYQSGHTGRHLYTHITGHPYLKFFPTPTEEEVTRTMDGLADDIIVQFDGQSSGIKEQVPINAQVSLFRRAFTGNCASTVTSSSATAVIRNGLTSLDPDRDSIIAIGGSGFDIRPFLLKGHGVDNISNTDDIYNLHLTPETESRVAMLETGDSDFPYVEVHYNAVDLTGDTMGTSGPCLIVEKTVPAGGCLINAKRVASTISSTISSGRTLHAPGGIVIFDEKEVGNASEVLTSHRMVGDNTGGKQYEIELDTSRLPSNYTPQSATDVPQSGPIGVELSIEEPTHPSVYHHAVFQAPVKGKSNPPETTDKFFRRAPASGNRGSVAQSTNAFEVFDIIDNVKQGNEYLFILQPSKRNRTMQLSKVVSKSEDHSDPSFMSLEYLQCRGKVSNIKVTQSDVGRFVILKARGLMEDVASVEAQFTGDGSPDSHLIKELKSDGPVVTVTLGGPGQGAVNTKPTWDPSPISRLGWSTRRDCVVKISNVNSGVAPCEIDIVPLNNESSALASWGSYCFPPRGRIYLESGANAEYHKVTSDGFELYGTTGALGTGVFINADGSEEDRFSDWVAVSDNEISKGELISLDPLFNEASVCNDGTTINDRLFQSIGSVTHDYQLGTQYASTRALVEIPLFPDQFFENRDAGIFPGPDNSMKIHLDATLTAHTWAPNPVGRRCSDLPPADREVMGSYHRRWVDNDDRHGMRVTRVDIAQYRLYIDNMDRIPDSAWVKGLVRYGEHDVRMRRVFRGNGEWALIHEVDRTNGWIEFPQGKTSADFLQGLDTGEVLYFSSSFPDNIPPPIRDDDFALSANREFRRPFYYDRANIQTQGGNIDYGLRQYVSAVEFKAGPKENPHCGRIESGGAVLTLLEHLGSNIYRFEGDMPLAAIPSGHIYEAIHENGESYAVTYVSSTNLDRITVVPYTGLSGSTAITSVLGKLTLKALTKGSASTFEYYIEDSTVNQTWGNGYSPGGLRYGDTVWMNMHYTNPHAVEGLFCKSRGVLNEFLVWNGFNGGRGEVGYQPRDSIPLENFLIGDTCTETAKNFAQHVNKTIAVNWEEMGYSTSAPVVAFIDPYLSTEGHARVLLYDVVHDREFIAFHDLYMQVQSSTMTPQVSGLDVASGFKSQIKTSTGSYGATASTTHNSGAGTNISGVVQSAIIDGKVDGNRSRFIEGAYAHKSWFLIDSDSTVGHPSSSQDVRYRGNNAHVDYGKSAVTISFADADGTVDKTVVLVSPDGTSKTYTAKASSSASSLEFDVTSTTADAKALALKEAIEHANGHSGKITVRLSSDDRGSGDNVLELTPQASAGGLSEITVASNLPDAVLFKTPHEGISERNEDSVCSIPSAITKHGDFLLSAESSLIQSSGATRYRFASTFFDTPDGTRAIPAFLCLKGKRTNTLDLSAHSASVATGTEARLNSLPQWTELDFVRRLPIDLGEVGVVEGVTDIEAAAREVVRLINQAGAPNGRSNLRRPSDQYPGEGERFGITQRGNNTALGSDTSQPIDPTSSHHHADFSVTGSTHDPAPFWDDTAFTSFDRGTHMGYLRAHLGRVVTDSDGNEGFSVIIHSTIPGASGRNFCAWLDNSKGQSLYRPQFLIGHGGRFRNFWCLPNESMGENMHPAPMPINKDGRPFAPITSLHELVPPDEEIDGFLSNTHVGYDSGVNSSSNNSGVTDALSEISTGRSSNTVNDESYEKQGISDVAVEGLRIGTRASARMNFGGIVAAGIPGWAPDAGKWGFGPENNEGRFAKIYSVAGPTEYSAYVPSDDVKTTAIGDSSLYGIRFVDHNGKSHTIRLIYRQEGESFSNDRTILPPSLENEIIIFFDDRDIAQGGFTLGKHMRGSAYPIGPYANEIDAPSWKGNLWRGVRAEENAYAVSVSVSSSDVLTISNLWNDVPTSSSLDALGWLGFPDSGTLLISPSDSGSGTSSTHVLHYTGRTHNRASGTHEFHGITGGTLSTIFDAASKKGPTSRGDSISPVLLSPALNQTTILTDEVIAAAVEFAMSITPGGKAQSFDCSEMYASNRKKFKDIMGDGAKTAIRVKTLNDKTKVMPLDTLFEVERLTDWGLYAGCITSAASDGGGTAPADNNHLGGLSRAEIDGGMRLDVGYLPRNILNIRTKYSGTNANTATPLLVDSNNNAVDVSDWKRHLRGELFTRYAGDHILPSIDGPITRVHSIDTSVSGYKTVKIYTDYTMFTFGPLGRYEAWRKNQLSETAADFNNSVDLSFVEKRVIWFDDERWALAQPLSDYNAVDDHYFGIINTEAKDSLSVAADDYVWYWGRGEEARIFDGVRIAGNTYGEPITYFRGAKDSPDHSVPLYFGGGFSGVVLDINDGTPNDYTSVMSHPYSSGPTGCAGLQNVGENMGSYALIDTTAIMAMFPGTHVLDQHRGEGGPPFANVDAILPTDISSDTDTHDPSDTLTKASVYGNVKVTKPIPVVLRFAHPYARYDDSSNEVAYVIFGPGQSVPKHWSGENAANAAASTEPSAKWNVNEVLYTFAYAASGGDGGAFYRGTPSGKYLPNEMSNGNSSLGGADAWLPKSHAYQVANVYPFNVLRHWEPAYGAPNSNFNLTSAVQGSLITNHFGSNGATAGSVYSHPFSFYDFTQISMHGDTDDALSWRVMFHMDGGSPPGGNWFDNAVRKNPPHPTNSNTITGQRTTNIASSAATHSIQLGTNATMFRIGSLALTEYDYDLSESNTPRDVFVVDASRCQNSEELATIISAAINNWPGEGNLKAIGGTFLPSFQDATRQDRYSWTKVGSVASDNYKIHGNSTNGHSYLGITPSGDGSPGKLPESLPAFGWVRLVRTSGSTDPVSLYGFYYGYNASENEIYLSNNFRSTLSGSAVRYLEDPTGSGTGALSANNTDPYDVYVWTQTGNHRWSNGAPETISGEGNYSASTATPPRNTILDALAGTQVHFSGYVDAVDRTRPVGSIGWHGERYSYLNSLKVDRADGEHGVAAGLGAWHPGLGFNPYGPSAQCHSLNSPFYVLTKSTTGSDPVIERYTYAQNGSSCPTGLHARHYVAVSYEGELPIIAKADREGIVLAGDMLDKKWGGGTGGTIVVSHNSRHNNDRFVAEANGGPHVDAQVAYANTNESLGFDTVFSPPINAYDGYASGAGSVTIAAGKPSATQTITIISTQGVSIQYTAVSGTANAALNQFSVDNNNDDVANSLETAIEHANGHNGAILVSRISNVLTLTQAYAGTAGNTTISSTLSNTTVSNFTGGTNNAAWTSSAAAGTAPMESCLFPTGDLFFDKGMNPGVSHYPDDALFSLSEGKASAKIVCVSGTPANYDGGAIVITDSAGTVRTYTWDDDAAPTDTAVVGSGTVRDVRIQGDTTGTLIAGRLKAAIEHSDGHNGTVGVSQLGGTLVLSQSTAGTAGNQTITKSGGGATATVNIAAGKPSATQTIVMVSTDDTSVTYTAVSGTADAGLNQFSIDNNNDDVAASLEAAIEHANGHNGKILVSRSSNILTLTQATAGSAGNNTISSSLSNTTVSGFASGFMGDDVVTITGFAGADTTKVLCSTDNNIALNLDAHDNAFDYWRSKSAARNFFSQHVVWKRMDGGNVCLPAQNARGLGAVPWVYRKVSSSYVKFGETVYGNVRFSFESTNKAMYPIIQAQELSHPQFAERFPHEIKNALDIPNEESQFEEIEVIDDTGQIHTLEGGSPFGTVIRDYELTSNRDVGGLAPALSGSGDSPNLKIQLPDADSIPGDILVRSGFDRLQAYQHETMGTGGLQRPSLPDSVVQSNFDSTNTNPSTGPFWENEGWERIDPRPNNFPDGRVGDMDNENPLATSYEPHDRALYFHVVRQGYTYTEREPLYISSLGVITHDEHTFVSYSGTVLTADSAVDSTVWKQDATPDGRYFLVVNGHVVSYTNVSGSTFTGCVFPPDFSASSGDTIKLSFYVPAGSTRHFAARRLRDHAEVSGESPDKKPITWSSVGNTTCPSTVIRSDRLTPMPIPRMGHHYVTPTMAMMPGHLAHPLYQRIYSSAFGCATTSIDSVEQDEGYTTLDNSRTFHADGTDGLMNNKKGVGINPLMWFSSLTSAHKPSDIHGGAFTLLTETKMRFDGYGIASTDTVNSTGGHRIRLEKGTNYALHWNFPDPLEAGAYQIVIQPNLFAQQFMGNNANESFGATGKPTGTVYPTLTDQQVNTVIALQADGATGFDLILAEATMADIRGCEIIINEVMLDIDPAPGQQFTSVPTLGLYNAFGVNEGTSGAFTRRSLPYRPNMFRKATPGYTLTVPWWAPAIKSSTVYATNPWRKLEHYLPDDYYHFCRSTLGAVGSQITLAGYPTYYIDPYIHTYSSLTPTCTFKKTTTAETSAGSSADGVIAVDNNDLFPLVGRDYWNHKLVITDSSGREHTATYTNRGYSSGTALTNTSRFTGVSGNAAFWSALSDGTTIRLSGAYGTLSPGEVYTKSDRSIATRNLPQLLAGTRDTNSLHSPDAYLCAWHYNLGRPMTYYSDSRTNIGDAAVDKSPYNHLPEHFETVHYHEFVYTMSDGPFDFRARHWSQAGGTIVDPDSFNVSYPPQARNDTQSSAKKYHFGAFWPGGSRFGAQMSTLTLWGTAAPGWGKYWDNRSIYRDTGSNGTSMGTVDSETLSDPVTGSDNISRNRGFGYRFGIRQPFNRPRWAIWSTTSLVDPYSNIHAGYKPGPFVQNDSQTTSTFIEGSSSSNSGIHSTSTATTSTSYVGVLERITNASAMVGSDLKIQQVRYSQGRRMTRPYGCAVRNFVNTDTVLRHHQGDRIAGIMSTVSKQRRNLALAISHYVIDWWGNTTGEDVRRFPLRGFGIRPAWDPEDAYRATDRTKSAQTFDDPARHKPSRAELDFFDPATAKRIGDRGDGRGVRWPTVFNEDVLQSVDTVMNPTGHVLSHHTSEPVFGKGLIRPSNSDLASDELKRGISNKLGVSSDDGLLKPEGMAGSNIERAKDTFVPANEFIQEPISRLSPRIGLDTMTVSEFNDGLSSEYVAMATEAHSLHTDRAIGRRYIMAAGIKTDTRAVADYDLTSLDFTSSFKQVMRLNMTHGLWPMGGTLILDLLNYMEPISDAGWGSSSGGSANPYQTSSHNPLASSGTRTNTTDKLLRLLVKPVRVLDHRHIEIFRDTSHALSGTAAGRYGVFTYSAPNARASSGRFVRSTNPAPDNPPYAPTYLFATSDYTTPTSSGPVIPGTEASGFSESLKQTVARIIVSSNTLQHFRADAARRQSRRSGDEDVIRNDYSVQPRFTQSVYPGSYQNTSTHTNESSHSDNQVSS
tara:strand:+ start:4637 stop:21703 length:17067 start_codon:yes stop_codon:yes gene_type:complete